MLSSLVTSIFRRTFPSKLSRLVSLTQVHKACKVCDSPNVSKVGQVDFNSSTSSRSVDIPVEYRQCNACGFAWAPAFDDWNSARFLRYIYNRELLRFETPHNSYTRSVNVTAMLRVWLADFPATTRILDYGCGPGLLVDSLRQLGFSIAGYDPFQPTFSDQPNGKFDVITCFEVLEHVNEIERTVDHMLSFLEPTGLIILSTFLVPRPMEINWWYCTPRSGHISFWTVSALKALFKKRNLNVASDGKVFSFVFPKGAGKIAEKMVRNAPYVETPGAQR